MTDRLETEQYKRLAGAGVVAAVLVVHFEVTDIASTWAEWNVYLAVRDQFAGVPGTNVFDADQIATVTYVAYLIAFAAAASAFLVWLWSARHNAELLCLARHRKSRGWLTGAWICPVVNLWFPFMIVDDIYRASRPGNPRDLMDLRSVPGSPLLGWWWALWLAATVPNVILLVMSSDVVTVDSLRTTAIAATASTALSIGAAVLVIMIMRRVTGWQTAQ